MGRLKLQTGIKAIEEEPEDCEAANSNKATLACIINSEIGSVLAVMRRNVRWGSRYISGDDQLEHSLIQSLKALRKQIFSWQHQWHTINPVVYLQPFLDVIRSDETGAPITGAALSSIYNILTLDVIDQNSVNVEDAMNLLVDAITSCRFEVTDPASEEVVLMKILQVLLACMKSKASVMLSNQHVCTIVNTCFRIVHQAGTKGELLQRIARHTMHELVRCIFSHLPDVHDTERALLNGSTTRKQEIAGLNNEYAFGSRQLENGNLSSGYDGQPLSTSPPSNASSGLVAPGIDESVLTVSTEKEAVQYDLHIMTEPYGVPCMVEIFHFLCSLLNVSEHMGVGPRSNTITFDEDVPLFALVMINSAIELGGSHIQNHPKLLSLVQDELFRNLMQFGLSTSPLILSMVCSIVLNLYHHLRTELKLQLEAFFSCVILRLAQSKYGASYQQQEVAMEVLVDFCRQKKFMVEMYANLDCDITCSNVFEELANLLSKSAFPVNCPLSSIHILALDGLIAVIQGMAERVGNGSVSAHTPVNLEEYTPFWMVKCDNYSDPSNWVPFVRRRKYIKRRLMIGADHFNRDPKKGLEFLQGTYLLPDKLDPQSVACFFRYTAGLDKNLVGDFLGNHDEFCVQVLHKFAGTFDFADMNLDTALRLFLETFRLPGESQKIQRVLEAFSERYYEQSPLILANKDAALLLSYSLIMLNTDQHNVQVKKKMTEEDFIRNNRHINGGSDLPREFLTELYHSICKNEIRTTPEQGAGYPEMTPSRWIDLMHKSKKNAPFIMSDSRAYLDHDMFAIMSGPTIAAISVVFDHAEHEEIYQTCIDGFLAVAKISACHHLEDVLDDLVVSLCKFTTLLNPSSVEEPVLAFGDDTKARMATVTVFTIANRYGDYIRTSKATSYMKGKGSHIPSSLSLSLSLSLSTFSVQILRAKSEHKHHCYKLNLHQKMEPRCFSAVGSIAKLTSFTILLAFLLSCFTFTSTEAYDALDPTGNITIKWDVISWTPDGYVAVVTMFNFQQYRHIQAPGWTLGWTWAKKEVIWSMVGAQTTEQGDCSKYKGNVPHCCKKDPTVVDLLPGTPYNQQIANCCKGGVMQSWIQDPPNAISSFQVSVGAAGTTNKTVRLPKNFTLRAPGPGYSCGIAKIVKPTRFLTSDKRRWTQAMMTWNVTCTYSQFLAQKTPTCCVSLSSFYNETIVSCPTCACGCQNNATDPGSCVEPKNPYLASAVAGSGKSANTPLVQCTSHMCPIRVHWHVKLNYKDYWRVKVTITNFNYRMNYTLWNLVVQHPNFDNLTKIFSFNYKSLTPYVGLNDTAMLWGVKFYNDFLSEAGPLGNVQSELLFRKDTSTFTFEKGWAFPRRIYFNGDNCVMPPPDAYPWLPNASPKRIISILGPVMTAFASLVILLAYA